MTLPNDYAHCPGADWEECRDCQRRTVPPGGNQIAPPKIVTFVCETYIAPDGFYDQILQDLVNQINSPTTTT